MATKKQSFEQPKDNAASKSAPGRKPSGESSTSPGQSTAANQGAQSNQGTQANQDAKSNQGAQSNQGTTGQNTGAGQNAATGQNRGTAGQNTGQGAAGGQGAGTGQSAGMGQNKGVGQGTAPNQKPTGSQGAMSQQTSGQGSQQTPGQGSQRTPGQGATGQQSGGQKDLLQHAKNATGEIVNQVQQQAGSQIARQKDSAATDLTQVVQAVRRFGESLTGQQEGGPIARYAAEYGDKAADSLERFSTYIREQDPKQLLNDVQNFGRRRPALLLGGAFLLGLAGARLIKSSMSMESHHQSFHPNTPAMRPPTSPNAV